MRVVLDTNILVSALIYSRGTPDAIYRAWRARRFDLVTSTLQLDKLRRQTTKKRLLEQPFTLRCDMGDQSPAGIAARPASSASACAMKSCGRRFLKVLRLASFQRSAGN